ncbi:hypothetical protein TSMEX_007941 [Taenia solium]|eukprot:TsM_000951500 transcript=TsM_000951500 gene=TsM_000951500
MDTPTVERSAQERGTSPRVAPREQAECAAHTEQHDAPRLEAPFKVKEGIVLGQNIYSGNRGLEGCWHDPEAGRPASTICHPSDRNLQFEQTKYYKYGYN